MPKPYQPGGRETNAPSSLKFGQNQNISDMSHKLFGQNQNFSGGNKELGRIKNSNLKRSKLFSKNN